MLTRQIVNSARAFFNAPIPTYGVAGSYAAALYSAAKKGGDQVRDLFAKKNNDNYSQQLFPDWSHKD